MKKDRESVKILLELIQYNNHIWDVCGDFKMIAFLLGLQGGYTKHSCFLCLWNSRANEQHYLVKNWPARTDLTPGSHNVVNSSLIERSKILLPPLHIKLGLAKQFVKALKPTSRAFPVADLGGGMGGCIPPTSLKVTIFSEKSASISNNSAPFRDASPPPTDLNVTNPAKNRSQFW